MWQLPKMDVDNILIYLRKSRTDDPLLSVAEVLSKHEQMLSGWVEQNFPGQGGVPESNLYREVVSGETIDSRPQVQALLRRIESPHIKAILIVEPQRLSRGDLEDIGRLIKLLRYTNTIVITIQYTYDLTDERDRDLFERELKRGNEFLEYQKRIMNNGRLLSVQNGNYVANVPPYGYKKVVKKDGKQTVHTLEINPEEADVVRRIFAAYIRGDSAWKIVTDLNAMGIKTAHDETWRISSVKHIIQNEHYIGNIIWNRRKTEKIVENGEIIATRPRHKEYMSFPGKHEAIIDLDTWEAAQAIHNSHVPVQHRARHANPFAGLVYCQCGSSMSRRKYTRNGKERSAPRMLCDNQVNCHTPSCTEEEMREIVLGALEAAIADFDLKIEHADESQTAEREQRIVRLEKRLEDLDRQEVSMWDKYTQEAMPKSVFDTLSRRLADDRTAARRELEEALTELPEKVDYAKKRATFASALELLRDPQGDIRTQNLLLKQCITRITYNRKPREPGTGRWGVPEPIEADITFRV